MNDFNHPIDGSDMDRNTVRLERVTAGQCPLHPQAMQRFGHWLMCACRDASGFRCGVMAQETWRGIELAPGHRYLVE